MNGEPDEPDEPERYIAWRTKVQQNGRKHYCLASRRALALRTRAPYAH